MGCAALQQRSNLDLQKIIRKIAADSGLVFISEHAEFRMLERGIGIQEVFDVLCYGSIERPWQHNKEHDNVECRMERFVGGRDLAVMVALDDDNPDLLVITTFEIDH